MPTKGVSKFYCQCLHCSTSFINLAYWHHTNIDLSVITSFKFHQIYTWLLNHMCLRDAVLTVTVKEKWNISDSFRVEISSTLQNDIVARVGFTAKCKKCRRMKNRFDGKICVCYKWFGYLASLAEFAPHSIYFDTIFIEIWTFLATAVSMSLATSVSNRILRHKPDPASMLRKLVNAIPHKPSLDV